MAFQGRAHSIPPVMVSWSSPSGDLTDTWCPLLSVTPEEETQMCTAVVGQPSLLLEFGVGRPLGVRISRLLAPLPHCVRVAMASTQVWIYFNCPGVFLFKLEMSP